MFKYGFSWMKNDGLNKRTHNEYWWLTKHDGSIRLQSHHGQLPSVLNIGA